MIRIGISGWTYKGWRGTFYPEDLVQKKELEYASRQFRSIEINGTHSLQRPEVFQDWAQRTPDGFVFSVKGSRYITHLRRLKDVEVPLANFFASGVLALKEKLGPFLWQLPPNFLYDRERIESFLKLLPRTTKAAARLGKKHDATLKARAWLRVEKDTRLRHCLEVRHESFMVPEFFELLRRYRVAFVFADTAGKWPYGEDLTTDFIYIRLHGDKKLYVSGYGKPALKRWAAKISRWAEGGQIPGAQLVTPRKHGQSGKKDVYVYFDNDAKVKAPVDAHALEELVRSQK